MRFPFPPGLAVLLLLLVLGPGHVLGVPLRVATFNIEANRDLNGNITEALNDPGTSDYNSVRDILLRINADVVCLQEIANADVSGGTQGGTNSDVHSLAAELGLPYVHIPTNSGAFDFTLRNAILSRHPLLDIQDIGSGAYLDAIGSVGTGGGTAKDVSRVMPGVVVDVPGASAPTTVITLHAKSSTGLDDRFRRAVEFARVEQYLANNSLDASDQVIILGDFNLSSSGFTFNSEPTGLPGTWNRGTEVALPITYATDPDFYFPAPYHLVALDPRDLNGTPYTFSLGTTTIDFILPSPALTNTGSEIYRSNLDVDNIAGLSKSGSPLNDTTSFTASDHYAVFADFALPDAGVDEYVFTAPAQTILETFDSFAGTGDPLNWTSTPAGGWQGTNDGSSTTAGKHAYGNTEMALGSLTNADTSFTARFRNATGSPVTALRIACGAEQWGVITGGSADTWSAELVIGASTTALGPLAFTADTSGMITPGTATSLSAIVTNLTLPDDTGFELRFTAKPGTGGGTPSDDVFINEFHYDNASTDIGEFVEVIVGPGFTGALADLSIVFYNGSNGESYMTETLDTFSLGTTTSSGHRIYHKDIPDIQNGGPDGIALVHDGSVLQFLSYEGTFTAMEGPANGITSTDIGVSQTTSTPAGVNSLGLAGTGDNATAFTWMKFPGAYTQGAPNDGQTFVTLSTPQGIAIDNLSVTVLVDTDGDGDPDLTDSDDDNDTLPDTDEAALGTDPLLADTDDNGTEDGDEDPDQDHQSNAAELLVTLTNPLDPNSLFFLESSPNPGNPDGTILSFPSIVGRTYTVWRSHNLGTWTNLGTTPGTGAVVDLSVPGDPARPVNLFRIEVSLPAP